MTEVKICYKCKKEIIQAVCDWYITHICESTDEYECSECWNSYHETRYKEELHARRILERILKERLERSFEND